MLGKDILNLNNGSSDIAIVGMASHFPDTASLHDFWRNINGKKDSITDIDTLPGDDYWYKDDFYHPDATQADKTYGHKAGFIQPIDFDPVEFKIPPAIVDSISTAQLFALYVAKQAMEDAGLVGDGSLVDRDRIGVILGGSGNGNTSFSLAARQQAPYLRRIMVKSGLSEAVADDVINRVHDLYLEWNEDSFPGFLGNVACGRIASYFDLGGTSYMVDAACASSLAAIKSAVGELQSGSCDAVLTGGVNLENSAFSFLCFSKTPALSKSNLSRPFDQQSDGIMLGDGVGMLVLKRLEDAELNGDRIYAVLKAVEASSDGRAKSIFAPRYEGQVKAIHRAYQRAGIAPSDIQLVEAHGTGTASGDNTELKSLGAVFGEMALAPKSIALGSVKSQIGHTRCAAGAAAMIKVAMALSHKVLPPTINVEQPCDAVADKQAAFYANTDARPWMRPANNAPRRAALSAFGFGGTNFHAVLEEYEREPQGRYRLNDLPATLLFQAETPDALLTVCQAAATRATESSPDIMLREHLRQQDPQALPTEHARLLFVVEDAGQVASFLDMAVKQLSRQREQGWEHPAGIYYQPCAKATAGTVVAMFPGQGSQYVNMGRGVAVDFPELRQTLETLDTLAQDDNLPALSPVVYPIPAFNDIERQKQQQRLTETANAQPAIGAISAGYYNLLKNIGFKADFFCGHSYGEVTALWAAGALSDDDFYRVSLARGQAAALASKPGDNQDAGAMLAASLSTAEREAILAAYPDIVIANDNSSSQVVFGGASEQIHQLHQQLDAKKVHCRLLQVSAAFHTRYIAAAAAPFRQKLAAVNVQAPHGALYSTALAQAYPDTPAAITEVLANQLIQPVLFRQTIEALYQQGGRLFIEIGPKGVLGKLVADILKDRPHSVVSLNTSDKGEERVQLSRAIARLVAEGLPLTAFDRYARPAPLPSRKRSSVSVRLNGGFFLSAKNRARRLNALRDGDTRVVDQFIAERAVVATPPQADTRPNATVSPRSDVLKTDVLKTDVLKTEVLKTTAPNAAVRQTETLKTGIGPSAASEPAFPAPASRTQDIGKPSLPTSERDTVMENKAPLTHSHDNGTLHGLLTAQQVMSQLHQQFQSNQKEYISLLESLLNKQFTLLDKYPDHQNLPHMLTSLGQSVQLLNKNLELYHANHERYFATQQDLFDVNDNHNAISQPRRAVIAAPVSGNTVLSVTAVPVTAPAVAAPVTPVVAAVAPIVPVAASAPSLPAIPDPVIAASPAPVAVSVAAPVVAPVAVQETAAAAAAAPAAATAPAAKVLTAEEEEQVARFEAIQVEEITAKLIAIVSDRTGYPQDMIDGEMDLEADLGIDSIKRLEIFGAMFDAFSADAGVYHDASKNKDLETLDIEALSNINKMSDFFMGMIAEIIADIRGGGTQESETESAREFFVEENLRESEAKGGRDTGSEATLRSLGFVTTTTVDNTVKKPLAESRATGVIQPTTAQFAASTVDAAIVETPVADTHGVGRYDVVQQPLPLPDRLPQAFAAARTWLVIDEEGQTPTALLQQLAQHGQRTVWMTVLPAAPKGKKRRKSSAALTLVQPDAAALDDAIATLEAQHGAIGGVIYLQAARPAVKQLREVFRPQDYSAVETLFLLARRLQPSLTQADNGYFLVVARGDGELGTAQRQMLPVVTGGVTGLTKALNIEWKSVFCRTVDIAASLGDEAVARIVCEELQDSNQTIGEVGRPAGGERMTLALRPAAAALTAGESTVTAQDVFVVTGGARGITAGCVQALAQGTPATFILLGRTDIDAPLPEWAVGAQTPEARKAAAIASLQQQQVQPTPVKISAMLSGLEHNAEVRQTLQAIEQRGAKAVYRQCDITNREQLAAILADVAAQYGAVTGIIHGAGNLADKRIEKKTLDDLRSVFDVKVRGLENLLQALEPSQLRQVILFSSVSGFFGNAGQTDYALANEILNKFSWLPLAGKQRPVLRAINWGPWDGGMVNDTLKRAYDAQNMTIIPAAEGYRRFLDEFRDGVTRQVTIGGASYRAVQAVKALGQGETVHRYLLAQHNPFLLHHVINDKPVLPATAAIAWMAHTAVERFPGYRVTAVDAFSVLKGIVFDGSQREDWQVQWQPAAGYQPGDETLALEMVILNDRGEKHYQAKLTLGVKAPAAQQLQVAADLTSRTGLDQPVYGDMRQGSLLFHGDAFRGIRELVRIDDESLTLLCQLPEATTAGQFATTAFDFFVHDVGLQLPLMWLMLRSDKAGLPSGIGRIEHLAPIPAGVPFFASMHIVKQTLSSFITDIVLHDQQGHIYSRLSQVEFTASSALRKLFCYSQAESVIANK
ncbi:Erythronolide synthase, modules 3 and 4 [Dickeya solani]|uniref:Polyketide synthase n=1 Tax=Dickeya solani D s0432-1 TaxID=1231725 RepID=A0AAV3KBS4_9GAMM|nr:type I polyketide synthase [Dickeya solani]ANE76720.1 polyketide synthase [Dickeya solani IPO 2222]AUH07868.1 polyketide synthase [Dickeya solani D s0432-1]AUC44390.1 omega-3 polyunsaturated fatty acid synthase subunit, PfaA [Dickeya solani RNS 08.23.3.1.A]AUH11891.1 polyketide synthase [Dickeya solani]AYQ47237.1 Erythronolide synthase, modules 3 and 4 [Dickeya solani]